MTRDKVFLLCLGAPRCGTTWLYHYLRSFDEVALGFKKEFHVFDAVYLPHCRYFATPAPRASPRQPFVRRHLEERALLGAFRDDHERYFDYFASLLDDDSRHVTADISPTYLSLPPEVLRFVADGFRRRGIQARALLLMRDPVERILSSARMAYRLGRLEGKRIDRRVPFERFLADFARRPHVRANTDYEHAIAAIGSVFAHGQGCFGFLETLFGADEIARLSRFIGVPPRPELAKQVHNESRAGGPTVDAQVLRDIRDLYDAQYRACDAAFPGAALPSTWTHFPRHPGAPRAGAGTRAADG